VRVEELAKVAILWRKEALNRGDEAAASHEKTKITSPREKSYVLQGKRSIKKGGKTPLRPPLPRRACQRSFKKRA